MVSGPRPVTDLAALLELEAIKPDAYLGAGPVLGWGRIYGGQVVAQALRAAALTVEAPHLPHSLHAYFVRSGDEHRPVLYEVERVRDGRSFTTRQVVAYQQGGAILNLIASFQAEEHEPDVQGVTMPPAPDPDTLERQQPEGFIDRRDVERTKDPGIRGLTWLRTLQPLADDPVLQACGFAYISDDHALGLALYAHPLGVDWEKLMTASLDHAIWFHRPCRADEWLLFDLDGHGVANARGLSFGRVFDRRGRHVASIAQEALGRTRR
ncbi:MAG TPA: acyl-CoA thioesterase domain-containing protein [Acidimicrobiia bacterium]|jgi:acyl-CoA thioesterase-2